MKSASVDCAPVSGNWKITISSIAKARWFIYLAGWFNLALESLSRMR